MAESVMLSPHFLLEILPYLPIQDLLFVQGVCRTWRNVISSAKKLQTMLFMQPELPSEASQAVSGSTGVELNSLLQAKFPDFFYDNWVTHDANCKKHNLGPWESTELCAIKRPGKYNQSISLHTKTTIPIYMRPEASWRRMIPCRPAPNELQVSFSYGDDCRSSMLRCLHFSNIAQDDTSLSQDVPWLTFGQLYDIVEQGWFRGRALTALNPPREHWRERPANSVFFDYSQSHISRQPSDRSILIDPKSRWRAVLPNKTVGGPRIVLVHLNLTHYRRRCVYRHSHQVRHDAKRLEPKTFQDGFTFHQSVGKEFQWDEEHVVPNS